MSEQKARKNIKSRSFAFVCYPESLPPDWLDFLSQVGCETAISPLHDKDINADGTPKKPHYHVLVCFDGPTTFNSMKETFCDPLNATIPQPVKNVRGYYNYLTHKDNPEKAQYDEKDIKLLCGFSISHYDKLTGEEIKQIRHNILKLILDLDIVEYADLIEYLFLNDMFDELDIASTSTIYFKGYIDSRRNKFKNQKEE